MALSNWDTLAVDLQGNSIGGSYVSPAGVGVEIYKNWLYIQDQKAWRKGSYCKPTIMEIQHGHLTYCDVEIHAIRGPQNGVYVACWNWAFDEKKRGDRPEYMGMVGCGVYGYDYDEWIGVTDSSKAFLQTWVSTQYALYDEEQIQRMLEQMRRDKRSAEDIADAERIMRELAYDFPKAIAQVQIGENALRFNQGDAYFAEQLGSEVPATETGKAQPTVMSEIIDAMRESDES
jgi:hypothetical protein